MAKGQRQTVFRASEVQRRYRPLLDSAKEGPVKILDSDGTVLGLEAWEELEFGQRLRLRAAQIHQLARVHAAHGDEPASAWAEMTPFPWIDTLDADEVVEFSSEVRELLLQAASWGTMLELEGALDAWRSTADIYRAPEILEALRAEADDSDEVFPPSYYGISESEE